MQLRGRRVTLTQQQFRRWPRTHRKGGSGFAPRPLAERFWEKCDRTGGPDSCWPWLGCISRGGYGRLTLDGRTSAAHRVSWQITHTAPIAPGIDVCHKCDNRPCVNPAHLFLGTRADNMADMKAKGRGNCARGERHNKAKLTREKVADIRARFASGESKKSLAKAFGVTRRNVKLIVEGATWR